MMGCLAAFRVINLLRLNDQKSRQHFDKALSRWEKSDQARLPSIRWQFLAAGDHFMADVNPVERTRRYNGIPDRPDIVEIMKNLH